MKLQSKFLFCVFGIYLALIGTMYFMLSNQIWPILNHIEVINAKKDIDRILVKVNSETERLGRLAKMWAARKDVIRFMGSKDKESENIIFDSRIFRDNEINALFVYGKDGNVFSGKFFDYHENKDVWIPGFHSRSPQKLGALLDHLDPKSVLKGLATNDQRIFLFGAKAIKAKDGESSLGTILVGRFIDKRAIEDISESSGFRVRLWNLKGESLPSEVESSYVRMERSGLFDIQEVSGDRLHGYALMPDVFGEPAVIVEVEIPKNIGELSERLFRLISGSLLLVISGFLLIGWVVVHCIFMKPIKDVREEMEDFLEGKKENLDTLSNRKDEIGDIMNAFSELSESIDESQVIHVERNEEVLESLGKWNKDESRIRKRREGRKRSGRRWRIKTKNQAIVFFGTLVSVLMALIIYGVNVFVDNTHANLSKSLISAGTRYSGSDKRSRMEIYLRF